MYSKPMTCIVARSAWLAVACLATAGLSSASADEQKSPVAPTAQVPKGKLDEKEEALPTTGDVAWDQLGLKLELSGPGAVERVHKGLRGGMLVVAVRPGSAASEGKVKKGDILVGLHHWETTARDSVPFTLGYAQGARMRSLTFFVVRDNEVRKGEFLLPANDMK